MKRHRAESAMGAARRGRLMALVVLVPACQAAASPPPLGAQVRARAAPAERSDSGPAEPLRTRIERLLAEGRALTATREISAALSTAEAPADSATILLAARANAAARSWRGVRRLLSARAWLDTYAGGEGRLLLSLAHLALGEPEEAEAGFRRFLDGIGGAGRGPPGKSLLLRARVGYARALEARGAHPAAAAAWLEAAAVDRGIGQWFLLSALQNWSLAGRPEEALRSARRLQGLRAVWRDSIWTEVARAAFHAGDTVRGLAFADSAGSNGRASLAGSWIGPALLATTGDSSAVKRLLRRALRLRNPEPESGSLLLVLEPGWRATRDVAVSDMRAGRPERAARLFADAAAKAPDAERALLLLKQGEALFAAGRYRDTRSVLLSEATEGAPADSRLRARIRFLAGRADYRVGRRDEAAVVWRTLAVDPAAPDGARAGYLIADMLHEAGDVAEAREAYETVVRVHPFSRHAGASLMRLGLLEFLGGRSAEAARRFEEYRRRFRSGPWFQAATYWAARAHEAAGRAERANLLYREAVDHDPLSYYGIRAGQAAGLESWDRLRRQPRRAPVMLPARLDSLVQRMGRLRDLGWKQRALRELSARSRRGETPGVRLALALRLNERGWTWQGTGIGWQVHRSRGERWDDALLRAVFPLIYRPALESIGAQERLDPALLAALVRRESQFDRDVVSRASAVGLTQLLPSTAAQVARRLGITEFDADQLVVPETNLKIGGRHLRELLERYGGSLVPALIAYNAGSHRFSRWASYPEFGADSEVMIERIPFTETRRYVKALVAYRYVYRRLYGLGAPGRDEGARVDVSVPASASHGG